MGLPTIFVNWQPSRNDGSGMVHDLHTGLDILQVNSFPSLIQALGYVKYKHPGKRIFYRGQHHLYCDKKDENGICLFQPALFRGTGRDAENRTKRNRHLVDLISEFRKKNRRFASPEDFVDSTIEGLLQQYGIPTSWIDVVDNIWVALWFACFHSDNTVKVFSKTVTGRFPREFIHMVRRNPDSEREQNPLGSFAYIFLLGEKSDTRTEILDLREKIPSDFIRPHVQHGLLIRQLSKQKKPAPNMFNLIHGIIRIRLVDALKWLGEGGILTPENMMPPPNYDSGFLQLLNSENKMRKDLHFLFPIYF